VPPLRDRKDDIPLLADHFMADSRGSTAAGKDAVPLRRHALQGYPWPGNVRELRNVIERLVIMVPEDTITAQDLGLPLDAATHPWGGLEAAVEPGITLHDARERFERDFILRTLAAQQGNISRTSELLG
jgi:two-component system, NtrC family, nitrogen regulation response regulator NtrX